MAVLGRDLRNPVAAVGAALRILGREEQSARAEEILGLAEQSLSRMTDLIEDILDLARVHLGAGLEVTLRPGVALGPVAGQVVEEVRLSCPGAWIVASLDVPEPVTCDLVRIARLFSNLVTNAATPGAEAMPIAVSAGVAGRALQSGSRMPATRSGISGRSCSRGSRARPRCRRRAASASAWWHRAGNRTGP